MGLSIFFNHHSWRKPHDWWGFPPGGHPRCHWGPSLRPWCIDAVVILWIHRIRRHQRLSNAGLRTKGSQEQQHPQGWQHVNLRQPSGVFPHGFTAIFNWIRTAGTYPLCCGWCLTADGWLVTQESAPKPFKFGNSLSHQDETGGCLGS